MQEHALSYLTTLDVAKQLDCSPERVRQLANLGYLAPAGLTHRGWRLFDPADVNRYQRERDERRKRSAVA